MPRVISGSWLMLIGSPIILAGLAKGCIIRTWDEIVFQLNLRFTVSEMSPKSPWALELHCARIQPYVGPGFRPSYLPWFLLCNLPDDSPPSSFFLELEPMFNLVLLSWFYILYSFCLNKTRSQRWSEGICSLYFRSLFGGSTANR